MWQTVVARWMVGYFDWTLNNKFNEIPTISDDDDDDDYEMMSVRYSLFFCCRCRLPQHSYKIELIWTVADCFVVECVIIVSSGVLCKWIAKWSILWFATLFCFTTGLLPLLLLPTCQLHTNAHLENTAVDKKLFFFLHFALAAIFTLHQFQTHKV